MKNDSKNKLGEVVVETVTVVEEEVPSSIIVEEEIPAETIVIDDTNPTVTSIPSSVVVPDGNGNDVDGSKVISSDSQGDDLNNAPSGEESNSTSGDSGSTQTSTPDSSGSSSSSSTNTTGSSSESSKGDKQDDPAESKLQENSERNPSNNNQNSASNPHGSSDAANRLRNNNPNNRQGNNNPNSRLGNNNPNNNLGNNLNNNSNNKPKDNAERKLANNKSNKARNLPFFNRNKNKNSDQTNLNPSDNGSNNTSDENGIEDLKKKAKQIKMILSILVACLPIIFIILVLVVIVSTVGSLVNMFGIVSTGGGGDFPTSMTDNPNEKKYYDKLDSVVISYQKKCGITINKNYIHAILFYPIQNYDEFFDQDFEFNNDGSSSNDVDYNSLAGKVDNVASLLVNNCSVDYEVGSNSYEKVKNSSFFKNYYKDMLEDNDADSILTSVFDLAEAGTEMFSNSWYINDNLKVVLRTCNTNEYLNGTKENSTVGFSEYIMGVLYGILDTNSEIIRENKEFLKAQIVAATSHVLSRAKYQSGDTEIEVSNGNCLQLSCDVNQGCTYAYDSGTYGTCYSGIQNKNNTEWTKEPISSSKLSIMREAMNGVFGTIMLDSSGAIKEVQPDIIDVQNGMTYKEILEKYYNNFTLSNASEDLYADVTYNEGGYNSNVVYYNQNNYNNKFCGRTDGTIATSGCGVVSMSIVLSTLVDEKFTPPVVMEEAYGFGSCGKGISGTSTSFFKKSANLHNLGYQKVGKRGDLQAVLNALSSGNSLVIAHMGPGTFTRSGHYIVLARVNNDGKVYVYDPNKTSRNGWHDFNSVIVKELRGSLYIISKR